MIPRFFRRLGFFSSVAWRPCTGPGRDEPPMNGLQAWWSYGISIPLAWELACSAHPSPATEAANRADIRRVLDEMRAAKGTNDGEPTT